VQRLTFIYLASYLLVGGLGLLVVPELALRLLLSNGSYGDVMPRLVGIFMLVLGGVVLQFVRARDYRYYRYTVIARIFIVVAVTALYFKSRDPLFLALDVIVLVGLLPSIYVTVLTARATKGSSSQVSARQHTWDVMSRSELLRWQWQGYPRYHWPRYCPGAARHLRHRRPFAARRPARSASRSRASGCRYTLRRGRRGRKN
jgi:hypothetical protein